MWIQEVLVELGLLSRLDRFSDAAGCLTAAENSGCSHTVVFEQDRSLFAVADSLIR